MFYRKIQFFTLFKSSIDNLSKIMLQSTGITLKNESNLSLKLTITEKLIPAYRDCKKKLRTRDIIYCRMR